MPEILSLWGKTAADGQFHPVLFHMLDVGHVAQCLLSGNAPRRLRFVLAHALESSTVAEVAAWLPFVTALHDLGKISAPFQRQVEVQRQRLAAHGFAFETPHHTFRHQLIGAACVDEALRSVPELQPLKRLLRDVWAGHHGVFATQNDLKLPRQYIQGVEPPMWASLRAEAIETLQSALPLTASIQTAPENLRRATAAVTGFVILCDWIGSDEGSFPAEPALSLGDYARLSQARARHAVASAGLTDTMTTTQWNGFDSVFPNIRSPRPLQAATDQLPEHATNWPALYVIEAPTGEGKTEAALALARRLARDGWSDEFYFALPTGATSNQMFIRILRFLESITGERTDAQLVHGQAMLTRDALIEQAYGDPLDAESPAYAVPSWFAPKKRALLAPFGVGTVDQAELAVLNARHYQLRLFGLAGKVVIIDEVHAYDTYMSTIIDHALWWFGLLGTSVILLSATLPQRRHREMARAFQRGLEGGAVTDDAGPAGPLPYPVLAAYPANADSVLLTPPANQPRRDLTLQLVPELTADEEANRLLRLVQHGGAVCRITNTVASAQEIYDRLLRLAPSDAEHYLLHARLPGDDRLRREQIISERLGPGSGRRVIDRIIVVGTQVLEQSLDLDFDAMITDHAPVDLLLQRAGRLHRHQGRTRPNGLERPTLQVALNVDADGLPRFGASEFVYEPFVLWKSWLTLRSRGDAHGQCRLTLPADYRPLIESAYDDRLDVLPEPDPGRERFVLAWEQYEANRVKMTDEAKLRLIPDPLPRRSMTEGVFLAFEEDDDGGRHGWGFAATRSGRESISVIPLHRVNDGVAIHPGGAPITRLNCGRDLQLWLLRRAIRVSNATVVRVLPQLAHQELPWFGEQPLLRYHVPLILDHARKELGHVTLVLDDELGLLIRREERE